MQTYKTSTNATGARCVAIDSTKSKLLIAGIVLAGVLLFALLFAGIMFLRYRQPLSPLMNTILPMASCMLGFAGMHGCSAAQTLQVNRRMSFELRCFSSYT